GFELKCPSHRLVIRACARRLCCFHYPPINPQSVALLQLHRSGLGGNWSGSVTFKENHELIVRGPYRFVRHPIYTGILLMILGTAIISGRAVAFLALIIGFLIYWQRLRQEEALLTKHFPETYPGYKSRTKALIPFLF
ncbi:MAG: isoprenylcysteine carboxylmethyltransferase family protein, partial [Verrucomicrobiota bacterium]